MEVSSVGLQVLAQLVDPFRQQSHLHFWGAGVIPVTPVLAQDALLGLTLQHARSSSSRKPARRKMTPAAERPLEQRCSQPGAFNHRSTGGGRKQTKALRIYLIVEYYSISLTLCGMERSPEPSWRPQGRLQSAPAARLLPETGLHIATTRQMRARAAHHRPRRPPGADGPQPTAWCPRTSDEPRRWRPPGRSFRGSSHRGG